MLKFTGLLLISMLSACGSENNCSDVKGPPNSIYNNGTSTTYRWDDCSRTYPN